MSKEGILSILIDLRDRAQRFHPSTFDTAEPFGCELRAERLVAGCGSPQPLAAGAASLIK
jgi:hypothetical protein